MKALSLTQSHKVSIKDFGANARVSCTRDVRGSSAGPPEPAPAPSESSELAANTLLSMRDGFSGKVPYVHADVSLPDEARAYVHSRTHPGEGTQPLVQSAPRGAPTYTQPLRRLDTPSVYTESVDQADWELSVNNDVYMPTGHGTQQVHVPSLPLRIHRGSRHLLFTVIMYQGVV